MKFTLKVVGDVCVLKLEGKFMVSGDSFFLREKLKNVLSMGIQKILIDMDNVPYIDSTGVGFLVSTHASITQQGGHLKLLKVKPKILEVLKIMNLHRVFEIFEDEQLALSSLVDTDKEKEKDNKDPTAAPSKRKRSSKVAKE